MTHKFFKVVLAKDLVNLLILSLTLGVKFAFEIAVELLVELFLGDDCEFLN